MSRRPNAGVRTALTVLLTLLALSGCGRGEAPPPVIDEAILDTGAQAARLLREGLVKRLTSALDSAGPVAAIEVCARDARTLTDSIARVAGAGIEIKRTADRLRNPMNAPDARERAALAMYAAELSAGRPAPDRYVQPAGEDGVRYYEPLRIMPMCMQCHGPAEQLDPAVRAALAERYPEDRAVGYAEGEFRGLIRVSIPAPPHGAH